MNKGVDIQKICEAIKQELAQAVKGFPSLCLASLQVGSSYACGIYLASQKKMAQELGIEYRSVELKSQASVQEAVDRLQELNNDPAVYGIIANKPFPDSWNEQVIFSAISEKKDVEGAHPANLGRLFYAESYFVSPTVLSVMEVLRRLELDLYGKEVTIVGFGNLIGRPLALLLGRRFATVNITHIATSAKGRLSFYVQNADILISAVGEPHLIKGSWIKQGAIVIDVGIGELDGKIVGDVEFKEAQSRAAFITPVPGGIGKLTTLFLFKNLLKAAEL